MRGRHAFLDIIRQVVRASTNTSGTMIGAPRLIISLLLEVFPRRCNGIHNCTDPNPDGCKLGTKIIDLLAQRGILFSE